MGDGYLNRMPIDRAGWDPDLPAHVAIPSYPHLYPHVSICHTHENGELLIVKGPRVLID